MSEILGEALEMDLGRGTIVPVIGDNAAGSFCAMPPYYDKTADEIANVALSYYDNSTDDEDNPRFVYKWRCTYRNEAFELGNIDCSALAGLILRGLKYSESPYGKAYAGDAENNISPGSLGDWVGTRTDGRYYCAAKVDRDSVNGASIIDEYINGSDPYDKHPDGIPDDWDPSPDPVLGTVDPVFNPDSVICNKDMRWAINPGDYWALGNYKTVDDGGDSEGDGDDEGVVSQIPAQGRPLSAANLAQLLLTMGYAVPLTGGFSAIKKGDFLFWASKYETGEHAGEYKRPNRFLRISHVAVCVDVDEHGDHWYVDSMSEDYAPDNTIRKECLETGIPKAEYLVLAIRLRQGRAWERIRIIYNPQDREMQVGEKQRFTCIAEGDIMHYQWQYCDDSYKEDTTKWTWVNSTLPRMASVSVTAQADMGYVDSNTGNRIRLYHCVCTDTHGRSLTSRNAVLTIPPAQTEEV